MERLQCLRGRRVVNETPLGRRLQAFFRRDDVIGLIVEAAGCGWQDGGCLTLARAVCRWLGGRGEPYGILWDGFRSVDHMAVRVGDVYLDSDGVASAGEFLRKMRYFESPLRERRRYVLCPEAGFAAAGYRNEIKFHPQVAARVAELLAAEFGEGFAFGPAPLFPHAEARRRAMNCSSYVNDRLNWEIVATAAPHARSGTAKSPTRYMVIDRDARRRYRVYRDGALYYVTVAGERLVVRDSDIPQCPRRVGVPDLRYTVGREWTGACTPRYVARFQGDWIAQGVTREEAEGAAWRHHDASAAYR